MSSRSLTLAALLAATAAAQGNSCPTPVQPVAGVAPVAASGYAWGVVATGLSKPRSLQIDQDGSLWVLESGKGLSKHTIKDDGGLCVSLSDSKTVIDDTTLNHGMVIDGKRVLVSSEELVYQVMLDDTGAAVVPDSKKTLVKGMTQTDHSTRTLQLVAGDNNKLIVARGSNANIDPSAGEKGTAHSTLKMFDISNVTEPYDQNNQGTLLGWGLRNDVGIVQHPTTGGLWTVENSVDELQRDDQDVHTDNPGEELNFLGTLGGQYNQTFQAKNFGYPNCLAAFKPEDLPANQNIKVGTQFAAKSTDDGQCAQFEAPRLTFPAHVAPIDIKFNDSAKESFISFHGSWNRDEPAGYSVVSVDWDPTTGEPVEPADSNKAANPIFTNNDNSVCPDSCFRPTGLAIDGQGRLFVASNGNDGSIYVLMKQATTKRDEPNVASSSRSLSGWAFAAISAVCAIAALV